MRELLSAVNGVLYYPILIIVLLACGFYFTIRTKFIQFGLLGEAFKVITEKPEGKDDVSSFQALMVSTASRVGTGNIVGVANAICLGGPGAVFWMWIIALIGGASAFIESTLAQIYKKRGSDGVSYGGPSYYIENALGSRGIGVLFAVALIATYAVGFNMLASFNLQDSFRVYDFYVPGKTSWMIGAVLAVLAGYCILGGGKRIIKYTSLLVPVMGVIFVIMALIMILINAKNIPAMFGMIFEDAFNFKAIFGGVAGSALVQGIKRGLYSNEAGMGSAPNVAATADVTHPVKQGLIQTLGVFTDTLVICTCTAFIILFSGLASTGEANGIKLTQMALNNEIGDIGTIYVAVAILFFAYSSILGNYYYGEANVRYITRQRWAIPVYRISVCGMVMFGALASLDLAWGLADIAMGFMTICNLIAIVLLGKYAFRLLEDYRIQKRSGIKNPVFTKDRMKDIEEDLECW